MLIDSEDEDVIQATPQASRGRVMKMKKKTYEVSLDKVKAPRKNGCVLGFLNRQIKSKILSRIKYIITKHSRIYQSSV